MAKLYAKAIKNGLLTIDDVPNEYRKKVEYYLELMEVNYD